MDIPNHFTVKCYNSYRREVIIEVDEDSLKVDGVSCELSKVKFLVVPGDRRHYELDIRSQKLHLFVEENAENSAHLVHWIVTHDPKRYGAYLPFRETPERFTVFADSKFAGDKPLNPSCMTLPIGMITVFAVWLIVSKWTFYSISFFSSLVIGTIAISVFVSWYSISNGNSVRELKIDGNSVTVRGKTYDVSKLYLTSSSRDSIFEEDSRKCFRLRCQGERFALASINNCWHNFESLCALLEEKATTVNKRDLANRCKTMSLYIYSGLSYLCFLIGIIGTVGAAKAYFIDSCAEDAEGLSYQGTCAIFIALFLKRKAKDTNKEEIVIPDCIDE